MKYFNQRLWFVILVPKFIYCVQTVPAAFKSVYAIVYRNSTKELNSAIIYGLQLTIYVSTLSCIWYFIGHNRFESKDHYSWVKHDTVIIESSPPSRYIRSLYYVLASLFTIGFGDIYPIATVEIVFTLFLILNGTMFGALLISYLTSCLSDRDISTNSYRNLSQQLVEFVRARFNKEHQSKSSDVIVSPAVNLQDYLSNLFLLQNAASTASILSDTVLPDSLIFSYKKSLLLNSFENSSYFKCYPNKYLIDNCVNATSYRMYAPNTEVVIRNTPLDSVYMVCSGKLEIHVVGLKNALCTFVPGDCYGYYEMLHCSEESTCSINITTSKSEYTQLAILKSSDFHGILNCGLRNSKVSKSAHLNAVSSVKKSHHEFVLRCHKMQSNMENLNQQSKQNKKLVALLATQYIKVQHCKYILLATSPYRIIWDLMMCFCILLVTIVIPLTWMHLFRLKQLNSISLNSDLPILLTFNFVFYFIFVSNLMLRMTVFPGVLMDGSTSITYSGVCSSFISCKRFWIALICCIPFEVVGCITGYFTCWYAFKLLSVLELPYLLFDIQKCMEVASVGKYSVSVDVIMMMVLAIVTLFVIIWNSSIWSILQFLGDAFISSVYFTLTVMTTTGYGDIIPDTTGQTLYTCGMCIICPCVCACIIGNIASYVHTTEKSTDSSEHRRTVVHCVIDHIQSVSSFHSLSTSRNSLSSPNNNSPGVLRRNSSLYSPLDRSNVSSRRSSVCSNTSSSFSSTIRSDSFLEDNNTSDHNNLYSMVESDNSMTSNDVELRRAFTNTYEQYYAYIDSTYAGYDGDLLFPSQLSTYMYLKYILEDVSAIVQSIKMFQRCPPLFIRQLVKLFTYNVYQEGETVYACNSDLIPNLGYLKGMYFIESGLIGMIQSNEQQDMIVDGDSDLNPDEAEMIYYARGEVFGGDSLFDGFNIPPVGGSFIAQSACKIYFLSAINFRNLLAAYPLSNLILQHMQTHCNTNRSTMKKTSIFANAYSQLKKAASIPKLLRNLSGKGNSTKSIDQVATNTTPSNDMACTVESIDEIPTVALVAKPNRANLKPVLLQAPVSNEMELIKLKAGKRNSIAKIRLGVAANITLAEKQLVVDEYVEYSWMLDPDGAVYAAWVVFLLLSVLVNAVLIPFGISYGASIPLKSSLSALFWQNPIIIMYCLTDLIYMIDICIRSCALGYFILSELVLSPYKTWNQYRNSYYFKLHGIACFPFDLLFIGVVGALCYRDSSSSLLHSSFSAVQWISCLRVNRCLRLRELSEHVATLEKFMMNNFSSFSLLRLNQNFIKLVGLVCVLCYCAHVAGCLFLTIGLHAFVNNKISWISQFEVIPNFCAEGVGGDCNNTILFQDRVTLYIRSVYWAISTLCTVGYGDVVAVSNSEKLFNIFAFVIGTIVYALITVNLQDIVSQLDVTNDTFKSREEKAKSFMNREIKLSVTISKDFIDRVANSFDMSWIISKGIHGVELRSYLSKRLYSQLILNDIRKYLKNMFFFKDLSEDALFDIAFCFIYSWYFPKDYLFRAGESANNLYIIISGETCLIGEGSNEGKQFSKHGIGPLGESEFFSRGCYNCSAVIPSDMSTSVSHSMAATIVLELSFEDYWNVLCKHKLQRKYVESLVHKHEHIRRQSSTFVVNKLQNNMKNTKMLKMLSPTMIVTKTNYSIAPESNIALVLQICAAAIMMYVAVTVPWMIFVPNVVNLYGMN